MDLLYPRECCACGNPLKEDPARALCWDCRSGTPTVMSPVCQLCGVAVPGRIDHAFTCLKCADKPPAFDRARSLYRYEGGVRDAIHALKYHHNFAVVPDLADLLAVGVNLTCPDPADWTLVPVPLFRSRLRNRGFNQSAELVRLLTRRIPGIRQWRGLRRVRDTGSQTTLSAAQRRDNVRGAFQVRAWPGRPVPERVVLIDDVMTTGATLDACARALRKAGVTEIQALTLARG